MSDERRGGVSESDEQQKKTDAPTQMMKEATVIAFLLPKASLTKDPTNAPPRVPMERRPTIKPDRTFEKTFVPVGSAELISPNLWTKLEKKSRRERKG